VGGASPPPATIPYRPYTSTITLPSPPSRRTGIEHVYHGLALAAQDHTHTPIFTSPALACQVGGASPPPATIPHRPHTSITTLPSAPSRHTGTEQVHHGLALAVQDHTHTPIFASLALACGHLQIEHVLVPGQRELISPVRSRGAMAEMLMPGTRRMPPPTVGITLFTAHW
jgi:hypothetical protein